MTAAAAAANNNSTPGESAASGGASVLLAGAGLLNATALAAVPGAFVAEIVASLQGILFVEVRDRW